MISDTDNYKIAQWFAGDQIIVCLVTMIILFFAYKKMRYVKLHILSDYSKVAVIFYVFIIINSCAIVIYSCILTVFTFKNNLITEDFVEQTFYYSMIANDILMCFQFFQMYWLLLFEKTKTLPTNSQLQSSEMDHTFSVLPIQNQEFWEKLFFILNGGIFIIDTSILITGCFYQIVLGYGIGVGMNIFFPLLLIITEIFLFIKHYDQRKMEIPVHINSLLYYLGLMAAGRITSAILYIICINNNNDNKQQDYYTSYYLIELNQQDQYLIFKNLLYIIVIFFTQIAPLLMTLRDQHAQIFIKSFLTESQVANINRIKRINIRQPLLLEDNSQFENKEHIIYIEKVKKIVPQKKQQDLLNQFNDNNEICQQNKLGPITVVKIEYGNEKPNNFLVMREINIIEKKDNIIIQSLQEIKNLYKLNLPFLHLPQYFTFDENKKQLIIFTKWFKKGNLSYRIKNLNKDFEEMEKQMKEQKNYQLQYKAKLQQQKQRIIKDNNNQKYADIEEEKQFQDNYQKNADLEEEKQNETNQYDISTNNSCKDIILTQSQFQNQKKYHYIELKLKYALLIAEIISQLHSLKPPLVHGHLKPQNILFDDKMHIALADFGLLEIKRLANKHNQYSNINNYSAPELLEKGQQIATICDSSVDVYSYGLILWEIFMEKKPFANLTIEELKQYHQQNKRPKINNEKVPENIALVIRLCWLKEAQDRTLMSNVIVALKTIAKDDFNIDFEEIMYKQWLYISEDYIPSNKKI